MSIRDISLGETIDVKFTCRAFATGIPTTPASLTIAAYPGNSITEITAGITTTFTTGFDARAGLVNVRVVATTGNGYATATDYALVVTAGTVSGVSIVGEVVGEFTIGRSAAATRVGILTAAAATGDPGTTTSLVQYVKQLINVLIGTTGITTFPAEAAPANAVSLAEVIRAIHTDVTGLNGAVMRGTDSAALATALATAQTDLNTLTDPSGEPAQGAPPVSATPKAKIDWLYKSWRNKKDNDGSTSNLYADDATTVDTKQTTSVAGGVVTKDEWVTGP